MGALNNDGYSSSDSRDLEESFAQMRLRSEPRKGDMKRIGRRSGGSTNATPVRKLDRLPFPSFLGILQDTAPRLEPTSGDVRTIIEYTTDPQLVAEVETLKARVAELEGINKELEETILEVQDVAVGKLTSLLQANEGHSDSLVQENKVQEKVKAIKDRIQRLLQQSNNDISVASGVLQSPAEQGNTCIAPPLIPLPPYDDDLRFEGWFDTHRTEVDNSEFDANEPVGMFIFEEKDERALVQDLTVNVDPSELLDNRPHGIIVYILFMCLRWADHMNNPRQMQSLLTNSISFIKHVATKNHNSVDLVSFWICNSYVLLNAMKYSEELQDG